MSVSRLNVQKAQATSEGHELHLAPESKRSDFILEVKNFSVDYGAGENAVRAVDDVSLKLRRSTVLGIAGESGSGKSTLVYAMTRLLRSPGVISAGDVTLNTTNNNSDTNEPVNLVTASEAELRRIRWSHVSIVLQSALNALNPVLRVGREFDEVLKTHRPEMSKTQRHERSENLLASVGLGGDRLARYPHELSGGQRQRVMIALALALDPELVIMDEPTTALDVVTQREIINELYDLRSRFNFAMIFITHDLSLLVELADEIVVMYAGQIVERAKANELYEAPRHPYTLGLLNSFPPMHGERRELFGIPGSPPDLADLPTGCNFSPRCPYVMERCRHDSPPLTTVDESERSVACWLHSSGQSTAIPVELTRRTDPARRQFGARGNRK
ncbi:MAG: ABC transporter ATP-binding protein [Acidimicrobiales bacterium]